MINKIEFSAKNLTSNAGLFLLLEHAYITGFVRSGNTYTANGAAEMTKEIVAQIKTEDLEILFRMDSGYFDYEIIETIESAGCQYLIKGKEYPTLASQVTAPPISFIRGDEFEYFYFVTITEMASEKMVIAYEKRSNAENYIKEAKYDMAVGHLLLQTFWANEAIFQLMMLAYNLFLLFKMDFAKGTEYRQQIKTFRLKYIFLAGKIIRTDRSVVMKLFEKYPHQEMYEKIIS